MTALRIASLLVSLLCGAPGFAETVRLAVTTSFHNSGLSDVLLPEIQSDTGIEVQLIVVGTGQALRLGQAGDVDAVLVHSKVAEDAFIASGYGTYRREIMYNDFVLIGPSEDPARAKEAKDIVNALQSISQTQSTFVSRGDDSGTHQREITLWTAANVLPDGSWYRELGSGMGATLNTASAMQAYVLADRGSWLNFGNKGQLAILFEGDQLLFNQYSFIPIDPTRHAHVEHELVLKLEKWLTSEKGQTMIGDFRINSQALFTPNASGM